MSQTKVKSGLLNFPDQTDFVKLPSGTTAQRPVSPEQGYSRYNTTDNKLEFWNGTKWQQLPELNPPTIITVSYPGDDLAADPAGGQTITLLGNNFSPGITVQIGTTLSSVVTFVSTTQITFEAPAKAAGDYDIVVTNLDNTSGSYINGISYNGVPSWTTPAGNLGDFLAGSTIPTITLVAAEPDSGVISYSVTTGALPTGLTLTGADIDGNVPTPAGETTYNFSVTASDDENQSTERAFNIVVFLCTTNTLDILEDGSCVATYQLDSNANDLSSNFNPISAQGLTFIPGKFNNGASLIKDLTTSGNSNILKSGWWVSSSLFDSKTETTLSFWVYRNNSADPIILKGLIFNGGQRPFAMQVIGTDITDYYFDTGASLNTNSIRIYCAGSVNSDIIRSIPYTAPVQQWFNLTFVFKGAETSFYVYANGQYLGSMSAPQWTILPNISSNNVPSNYNVFGSSPYSDVCGGGVLDQVRIFNKALSAGEVATLYNERACN